MVLTDQVREQPGIRLARGVCRMLLDEGFSVLTEFPVKTAPLVRFTQPFNTRHVIVLLLIGSWLLLQTAVPLRHWTLPGNVAWNEDGHRYSWRMKLRSKRGTAIYTVKTKDQQWRVNPATYLTAKQHQEQAKNGLKGPRQVTGFDHGAKVVVRQN